MIKNSTSSCTLVAGFFDPVLRFSFASCLAWRRPSASRGAKSPKTVLHPFVKPMRKKSSSVKFKYAGGKLTGSYAVSKNIVRVTTPHGTKSTQLGGSSADSLARILARELVDNQTRRLKG